MLGEQLNFLKIFDEANEPLPSKTGEDPKKELDKELINDDKNKRELTTAQEHEQRLQGLRKQLLCSLEPDVKEFHEFLPEIEAYEKRYQDLRKEYNQTKNTELYWVLVDPDINDEPAYREIASLYLKYLEAVKRDQIRQSIESKFKPKKVGLTYKDKRLKLPKDVPFSGKMASAGKD